MADSPKMSFRLPPALPPALAVRVRQRPTGQRPGVRPGPMRARILALLREHPEGLTAEELRVHLKAERPIGDILQGMVRQGLVVRQGYRKGGRYVDMRIGPRRA
jgi:DNA-binding transcriptional ArsR family regulator